MPVGRVVVAWCRNVSSEQWAGEEFLLGEEFEDFADGMAVFQWVAEACFVVELVVVATSFLVDCENAFVGEFRQNALDGALGDAYLVGHVANSEVRGAGEQHQNVGVVGEESPAVGGGCGFLGKF